MNLEIPKIYLEQSIEQLLNDKKIVLAKDNLPYHNTIFPISTEIRTIDNFSRNKIITKIDDDLFKDFYILNKMEQTVYLKNNSVRKFIKCKEYGDINNSHKRYNNVNSPIDYNKDANSFLNLSSDRLTPLVLPQMTKELIFNPTEPQEIKKELRNLPNVKPNLNDFKRFNDKTTIEYVLKWAKEQGITYIYAIVEKRPYVIDKKYTSSFAYYTVIGSKDIMESDTIQPVEFEPTHTVINTYLPSPIIPTPAPIPPYMLKLSVNNEPFKDFNKPEAVNLVIKNPVGIAVDIVSMNTFNNEIIVDDLEHPIEIKNTVNLIDTIQSTDLEYIVPNTDLEIIIKDQNNNILDNDNISLISGIDNGTQEYIINLPSDRPLSWPDRPINLDLKPGIFWLIEHLPNSTQTLYFRNAVDNTSMYIDDVYIQDMSSSGTFFDINYNDYGFNYLGRKFSWIYFETNNIPYIYLKNNNDTINPYSIKTTNLLEELINVDVLDYYVRPDAGQIYHIKMTTQILWFKPGIIINNSDGLFMNNNFCMIENPPMLRGTLIETFRDAKYTYNEIDCTYLTNLSYSFYSNTNRIPHSVKLYNTTNINNIQFIIQGNQKIVNFEMDDCSNITNATFAFQGCYYLQSLLIWNMKLSIDLTSCLSMTKNALLNMIATLADMTGDTSPSIILTGIPNGNDPDVAIAASNKNWTIVI